MPAAKLRLILDRALCPELLFTDHYEDFIDARSKRLAEAAWAVMGTSDEEQHRVHSTPSASRSASS